MKKNKYVIFLVCLYCFSCNNHNLISENEKALLSKIELSKLINTGTDNNQKSIKISFDSVKTYSDLELKINKFCKFSNNDNFNFFYINYDLKKLSFSSNNKNSNIKIPTYYIKCNNSNTSELLQSIFYDIHLKNNQDIEYKKYFESSDLVIFNNQTLKEKLNEEFYSIFNDFFKKNTLNGNLINPSKDEKFLNNIIFYLSIDTEQIFKNLEPIYKIIITTYLDNLNKCSKNFTQNELKNLKKSDISFIARNLGLNILITYPPIKFKNFSAPI